ncbi:alpha/beta hydrolase family protein [Candidatus Poriferisodalis sp.]|uniref:alpha/beta hydrolase family protein n=1 Tax=Candidatus Poriferisodalis sp. TaxID=3101277 RepID=UPI003B01B70B
MLPALTALLVGVMAFACSSPGISSPTTAGTDPITAITAAPEPPATTAPAATTELPAVPATSDQSESTVAPAADIGIGTELVGRWEGVTRIVALGELPFAVAFELSGDELLAAMDIQGGIGLDLVNVSLDGRHIHFELESPFGQAIWDGEVGDGVIDGDFNQADAAGIFRLERAGEPEPSAFRSDDVTFTNSDIVLAGQVTLPDGDGPHPAVVLISGSGDQTRDVDVAGFRVFAALAEELATIGIASLRYDDRGIGGSSGDGLQATIEDRAADVAAAVDLLVSRDDIDAKRIGLIGHSEGGMVAPLAASRSGRVAFVALLAAPAVPRPELLEAQLELLELSGMSQDQIEQYQAAQHMAFEAISTGQGWEDVERALRALARQQVQELPEQSRQALGDLDEYIDVVVSQDMTAWQSPWFVSTLQHDSAAAIAALDVPVLALFGELDTQVRAGPNASAVSEAIAASDVPSYAIGTVLGANHLFQAATTGSPDEYDLLRPEFAADFLAFLLPWLAEQVGSR